MKYQCVGMVGVLSVARMGVHEVKPHRDDPVGAWHLELEIGVVGCLHELGVAGVA